MPITPDQIENQVFSLVRRGYDPAEVDAFLREVATTLAQAQGGLATPAAPVEPAPVAAPEPATGDDYSRLGDEVAAILRQAHESVATMRHRAEADAALIREVANREATGIRAEAEAERLEAEQVLAQARSEAAAVRAELARERDAAAELTAAAARARAQQEVETARAGAQEALAVQRDVRGRLEGTRDDIDTALGRLVGEDEDPFDAIDTIDLTDTALAGGVPLPGQGPPSPPVPPPTGVGVDDLPYADGDDDEPMLGEDPGAVLDLTDGATGPNDEPPVAETPAIDADADAGPDAAEGETETTPDAAPEAAGTDDPLAQMVKNAVENALRRRKTDE